MLCSSFERIFLVAAANANLSLLATIVLLGIAPIVVMFAAQNLLAAPQTGFASLATPTISWVIRIPRSELLMFSAMADVVAAIPFADSLLIA